MSVIGEIGPQCNLTGFGHSSGMTDPLTQTFDLLQHGDMLALEGALVQLVQAVALLKIGQRHPPATRAGLLPGDAALVLAAHGEMRRLLARISDRVMDTSPDCHQEVRSQAAKIADTVERLERVVLRLQQTNNHKES